MTLRMEQRVHVLMYTTPEGDCVAQGLDWGLATEGIDFEQVLRDWVSKIYSFAERHLKQNIEFGHRVVIGHDLMPAAAFKFWKVAASHGLNNEPREFQFFKLAGSAEQSPRWVFRLTVVPIHLIDKQAIAVLCGHGDQEQPG